MDLYKKSVTQLHRSHNLNFSKTRWHMKCQVTFYRPAVDKPHHVSEQQFDRLCIFHLWKNNSRKVCENKNTDRCIIRACSIKYKTVYRYIYENLIQLTKHQMQSSRAYQCALYIYVVFGEPLLIYIKHDCNNFYFFLLDKHIHL